ncbi:UNKNOWN [Stylonychia lemnae]|uniref:Uncharacterized protein n=1 Tax=Stylonychia lemnae TaxID=5949 RepID=A0A077ZUK4_STYLE|nr:UNKNOWN [Stylonychia lemnae]|eukprot:CDW72146.1 UNKNOWN [Stylonychia lemnae]
MLIEFTFKNLRKEQSDLQLYSLVNGEKQLVDLDSIISSVEKLKKLKKYDANHVSSESDGSDSSDNSDNESSPKKKTEMLNTIRPLGSSPDRNDFNNSIKGRIKLPPIEIPQKRLSQIQMLRPIDMMPRLDLSKIPSLSLTDPLPIMAKKQLVNPEKKQVKQPSQQQQQIDKILNQAEGSRDQKAGARYLKLIGEQKIDKNFDNSRDLLINSESQQYELTFQKFESSGIKNAGQNLPTFSNNDIQQVPSAKNQRMMELIKIQSNQIAEEMLFEESHSSQENDHKNESNISIIEEEDEKNPQESQYCSLELIEQKQKKTLIIDESIGIRNKQSSTLQSENHITQRV